MLERVFCKFNLIPIYWPVILWSFAKFAKGNLKYLKSYKNMQTFCTQYGIKQLKEGPMLWSNANESFSIFITLKLFN